MDTNLRHVSFPVVSFSVPHHISVRELEEVYINFTCPLFQQISMRAFECSLE